MTLKEMQEHVRELREAQGWRDESPERRAMFLVTELGEVARETLKLSGAYGQLADTDHRQARENLGMEMYDIMWNLCDLANLLGIDLEAASARKAAINRLRKW